MKQICSSVKLFSYPAYYENDGTLVLMEGDTMEDDGLLEKGKNYIFVGTAQPDGSIFLESLYAKTEFNDDNYQRMTENMIEIKRANRNNFCETSMDAFDRSQEVQNVWRMKNGRLVLKFRPFTETWSPEQRRKKAGEILSGRFITFCAFEGDAVVGEIMLIPELNEGRLIIDSFHVSRPFRRCGIGRRLVETAAEYARGRGALALYASCCSAEETIDFYRAMGFQLSEHPIPSRVEDEPFDIQMELRL